MSEDADVFMVRWERDPDYRRMRARKDAELAARRALLDEAEQPVRDDIRARGFEIDRLDDLINTPLPYDEIHDILLAHLERGGYPDIIQEALGRSLAVASAVRYRSRLVAVYRTAPSAGAHRGAAVALTATTDERNVSDLIELLGEYPVREIGGLFLRPIVRFGGDAGRSFVSGLVFDPLFGREATALMKRATKTKAMNGE